VIEERCDDRDKKEIQKKYVKRGTKTLLSFLGVLKLARLYKKKIKRTQKEKEEIRISKYEST
jgi:hypothetical protein